MKWMLLFPFVFAAANSQNLLVQPESVEFDVQQNRYLVSNFGNGCIVEIDALGNQSYFSQDLMNTHNVVGLHIVDDQLFAAVNNGPLEGVVSFDLQSGEMANHYSIPGHDMLNDITSDGSGYFYISDYYASRIYKVHIESGDVSLLASQNLNYPNGIYYDSIQDRLLVLSVGGFNGPVLEVDTENGSVSIVHATGLSGMDGITMDSSGNFYISDWTTNSVYLYDCSFNLSGIVSSGNDAPADIFINREDNVLCIPNFYANTVDFIPIIPGEPCCQSGDVSQDGIINVLDVIQLVNCILDSENICMCGDMDDNGILDILDIVTIVNIIMG